MIHILIILSFLLLSSFLTSCEKKGQRTETYNDGDKYVGEFKDGIPNGKGTYTFGKGEWEGDKYVGEWKDGKPWNGKVYNKNGNITKKYVNGEIQK